MKKYIINLFSALLIVSAVSAQKKEITLEDIWSKGTFSGKGVAGFKSMNDGRYYCSLDEKQNLLRYQFAEGKLVDTLVRKSDLKLAESDKSIDLSSFEFSEDESRLLIATGAEPIYRHSYRALYYVYDLTNRKLIQPLNEKVMHATLSPNGRHMAYVKSNDLYYYDLMLQKELRVSKDGKVNNIINGSTDWVYEEEFAITKAFFWNGNSEKIAFYRFDESKVKEFDLTMYGHLYPVSDRFKYPKAGEDNSKINIFVYDLKSELIAEMNIGTETDIYIPRIQWTRDANTLCMQRLNRLQNKLELMLADAGSGKSRVIYTETNKYYIDVNDKINFLTDKKSFIITSERDGWNHLYHYDMNGKLIRQISKGNFDVAALQGIDEKNKRIYYTSCGEGATEHYVYAIGMNGKKPVKLSTRKGWNTPTFNSDHTCFLNAWSDINTPSVYSLHDQNGKEVRVLETNQALKEKLAGYDISPAYLTTFKNTAGTALNAWVIRPTAFDSSKKYPVLMYAYNGPGHQLAVNRWMGSNYYWFQHLAEKGYLIVCTDGRGTGARGEEFKKCTYLQLGKYETEDQIAVGKELGKLPYVDASRIGFWGWSYGGYMASLAISKGNDVFKTAIAVAPVTNWRYYDNIYTERFMRTPKENAEGYDSNSPINHVDKIKGNYLIIHGTADDNVHFQNTVEMVDAMIKKGVKFDSEFYPNRNHGISGGRHTRLHLYDKMTKFLMEKL